MLFIASARFNFLTSDVAIASHRAGNSWHQTKMHSASSTQKEAACVQPGGTNMPSGSDIRMNIRSKLYIDNPAQDWDLLASQKIYLDLPLVNGAYQPCTGFPNRSDIPIEIYVANDVSIKHTGWWAASPCGNTSCTSNSRQVWNPVVNHYDQADSLVYFRKASPGLYVNNTTWESDTQRSWLISHEFGHVFGLDDGGGDCATTIMHYWGNCYKIFWPSQQDRDTVTSIADNG